MERQEIIKICKKYKIKNYNINHDGSIDVNGSVDLYSQELTELPLRFNKVTGYFNCDFNNLTTLKGSPKWVGDRFSCSDNKLTSLEFSPEYVKGPFECVDNQLTDNYCDTEIGHNFYTTLKQDGLVFDYIVDILATNYNEWRALEKRKRTLDKLFQKDLVD